MIRSAVAQQIAAKEAELKSASTRRQGQLRKEIEALRTKAQRSKRIDPYSSAKTSAKAKTMRLTRTKPHLEWQTARERRDPQRPLVTSIDPRRPSIPAPGGEKRFSIAPPPGHKVPLEQPGPTSVDEMLSNAQAAQSMRQAASVALVASSQPDSSVTEVLSSGKSGDRRCSGMGTQTSATQGSSFRCRTGSDRCRIANPYVGLRFS